MSGPFKCFRVTASGDPYAFFQVAVIPAHWLRGEENQVEAQRRFIREAITEKLERLEREQGDETAA
jgi:hypothetical protein